MVVVIFNAATDLVFFTLSLAIDKAVVVVNILSQISRRREGGGL